jgi:hypothetical protein
MLTMTSHIYNIATTAASAIPMNELIPVVSIGAILAIAIATGLAGRLVLWCEDLRYTLAFGQDR